MPLKRESSPASNATLAHLEARGAVIGLATGNIEDGARHKLAAWRPVAALRVRRLRLGTRPRARILVRVAIERGVARAGRSFMRDEIWVIGDTPKDIAAAHAAGARAVAVATGWYTIDQLREAGADVAHPTMAEWLDTL